MTSEGLTFCETDIFLYIAVRIGSALRIIYWVKVVADITIM